MDVRPAKGMNLGTQFFLIVPFFFFKILFMYLTDRDHKEAERQAEREREEEAGSPPRREPDAGLDPRSPRP